MNALTKGLIVAAAHVTIVGALYGKFLIDRANYPRLWVQTAPLDPELPIRGRYVSLRLRIEPAEAQRGSEVFYGRLAVENSSLVAVSTSDNDGRHRFWRGFCGNAKCWTLDEPIAFFISQHVPDPSRRAPGEELWAEVTLPPTGAPRPVRLGVKKDGVLTPLALR